MSVKNDKIILEDDKNRINRVKKLILKKIADDIKKKEKRIPTEDEVIKIYEKKRAEYEKYVAKLAKNQKYMTDIKANKKKRSAVKVEKT
jgi:hypothetical protein